MHILFMKFLSEPYIVNYNRELIINHYHQFPSLSVI